MAEQRFNERNISRWSDMSSNAIFTYGTKQRNNSYMLPDIHLALVINVINPQSILGFLAMLKIEVKLMGFHLFLHQ